MHLSAKHGTLFFLGIVIAFLPQPTVAFQQPQPAVAAPSELSAFKTQGKEADALVTRVRALRWLDRDKEALDLAGTTSPDVKARLTKYIESTAQARGSEWAVQNAQQTIQKYASVPSNVALARAGLGEYDAAVKAGGEAIQRVSGTLSTVTGDKRTIYSMLSSEYENRGVASSAAGNRVGSQRDFQNALEFCRKADCERFSEGNIYFKRALSSFLLGDLSPAGNDCRVFSQFGAIYRGAVGYHSQQDADEMCAYILSNSTTQAAGGSTIVVPGSTTPVESTVRDEIEKIRGGTYAPMPPAQRSTSGGPVASGRTTMTVKNSTSYELSVFFDGPVSTKLTLVPGASQDVDLAAGTFHVAGRVAANVLPFYGEEAYGGSSRYSMTFYIAP
jgi:tetratricopeptide (TPR) repeat protein